jgi:hypothetical protein
MENRTSQIRKVYARMKECVSGVRDPCKSEGN